MHIYPSLISADLLNLEKVVTELNNHADGYHLDIMDGHFVPNITWGPMFINAIATITQLPLQIHAMVTNPQQWLDNLHLQQKDSFIFHYEAMQSMHQMSNLIHNLKSRSIRIGVAINPKTPAQVLTPWIHQVDEILVMSVEPGFSGQTFIDVTAKVAELKIIKQEAKASAKIGMDGGITAHHIPLLKKLGITFVGVASALFNHHDTIQALQTLRKACL